jgi:hypothetical protein
MAASGLPEQFEGEGFSFTIEMGSFDGLRLHVGVATVELWKTWCGLQTSYSWGGSLYECVPNWGFMFGNTCSLTNPMTQMQVSVDCGKLGLCDSPVGPCQCDATTCTVNTSMPDTTFDLEVAGSTADGSTTGAFSDHNVHFTHLE